MGMKEKAPSHGDIARLAGVSQPTVSRALKNDPRISRETREKVCGIARELGYRPDPEFEKAMQRMSRSRGGRLQALLGFIGGRRILGSWYARDILEGALERADALGYKGELFYLGDGGEEARVLERQLAARNIRGLLVLPLDEVEAAPLLSWERYAVVNTTSLAPHLAFHSVHNDDFGNGERLMQAILEAGYIRPGLLIPPDIDRRMHHALSANYHWTWAECLRRPAIPIFPLQSPFRRSELTAWYERYRPDAVLVADAGMHSWTRTAFTSDGAGPEWIAYTSAGAGFPGLRPDFRQVGSAAVDLLTAQIMRDEYGLPAFRKQVLVAAGLDPPRNRVHRRK